MTAKCCNCEVKLITRGISKKYGFLSLVKNKKVKIIDALGTVFPGTSDSTHSDDGIQIADRALCRGCVQLLGNMYQHFSEFRNKSKAESYCKKKYLTDNSVPESPGTRIYISSGQQTTTTSTSEANVQTRLTQQKLISAMSKTPVGKKMLKAQSDRKISFYRSVRVMVNKEVKYLTRHKEFNNKPDRENLLPPKNKVGLLLRNECPLVLAVLQGLCLKLTLKNDCTSSMTTVLGIALFSQNQKCNMLQKAVGLALWKTMASEKV
jgi:hypothetical protein